jgi:polygalacturonase
MQGMKRKLFVVFLFGMFTFSAFSQSLGVWNVYDYNAKGDGKTNDTQAIQSAIDACYRAGGGKVLLHNGRFLSGTVYLKSHVTLYIESGAVLLGSDNPADYPETKTVYPSTSGEMRIDKTLIFAEGSENIAIAGNGTIAGNGDELEIMERPRPHIIHFRFCRNVKIRDVRLYNAAFWVQKYQSCDNLLIDGITVDSRENKNIEEPRFIDVPGGRNTDGCNIVDCRNVRIAD